ncbi:AFR331Cp [Eremothecium gossypii ATCC 10895]|uniref:AFR331Cp n=1 Tax=Eremothecium gossypii (strain ATCC 10895 / CBS 109.51 / FGSC 9923 / NRRL Y-1056) TaxID=284811 RepID=Q753I1_EREGS|nr:AFR331Cp [Eremothecium gossypii ATCC 10895]AAS53702.1 AFR331Cp [Eremothecium gossypii ATCC 10895]AEY98015.1 FAFR331Cp [Eremothecium gossypii FDAG1]
MDDRLQHLDEMKRKLQQLRERRPLPSSGAAPTTPATAIGPKKSGNGFVSHLLRGIERVPTAGRLAQSSGSCRVDMASVAIQTDETVEQTELEGQLLGELQKVSAITYEKAVQTEAVDAAQEEFRPFEEEATQDGSSGESNLEEGDSSIATTEEEEPVRLKPLIVTGQSVSLETMTFALLEALENKRSLVNTYQLEDNEHFVYSHELVLDVVPNTIPMVVSLDYHEGFVLALVQLESKAHQYNSQTVCYVINFETGEIVDTIHFQGQTLIRGEFILIKESKILTMLLTSYNGKTILYELRAVASKTNSKSPSKPKLDRNVLSRNYHNWPIFALWQHHVRESKVLTASTDGMIHELNLIDLKPVLDPTSWNAVRVLPLSRSELILKEQYGNHKFLNQLSRLSLYDEITIKAICTFHNDPSSIYLGCEDGGIYKIVIEKGEGRRNIKVSLDNNGFIPDTRADREPVYSSREHEDEADDDDSERHQEPLFHSGSITRLFPCDGLPGLMVSSGMDWKCILWDVPNNERIFVIDVDSPVISCEWATLSEDNGVHYIALLTALDFHIYEVNLISTHTHLGNIRWSIQNFPKRVFSISATQTKHELHMFSYFKLIKQQEKWFVLLGGDQNTIECYCIFS